ncbi:filamin-C-like [Octopus sinensis]|uniref:Filamin-C-like n=1 Tax=Octopus sinensis TaxID=2607531 RepID=A0A6P7TYI7_9MOLL|nr:filamin-C-like [Octopus sinensis]
MSYTPKEAGKHKIYGLEKPNELEFYVNSKDAGLIAHGQGLVIGRENQICEFFLECPKEFGLCLMNDSDDTFESEINIIGPSKTGVVCKQVEPNISKIQYFPTKAGRYQIHITNGGKQISGSPFRVVILG